MNCESIVVLNGEYMECDIDPCNDYNFIELPNIKMLTKVLNMDNYHLMKGNALIVNKDGEIVFVFHKFTVFHFYKRSTSIRLSIEPYSQFSFDLPEIAAEQLDAFVGDISRDSIMMLYYKFCDYENEFNATINILKNIWPRSNTKSAIKNNSN